MRIAMSDYQYYEFCRLNSPLTVKARKEMAALSSRAKVGTHGASYVYNYGGDFRGDPKRLLVKHFDVFFYISKWGIVNLMFKYPKNMINTKSLKEHCSKNVAKCIKRGNYILLDVHVHNEDGWGWIEGEGLLPCILPLYYEIVDNDYRFLQIANAVSDEIDDEDLKIIINEKKMSEPQKEFFKIISFS